MLNKSIAYRLSIYISLAVIGVFLTFIIVAYYFNRDILRENITFKATALGSQVLSLAERKLVNTREVSSNISEQVLFYAQEDNVNLFLEGLLKKYPFLNAIHVNFDPDVPNLKYHNYFFFNAKDSIEVFKDDQPVHQCENEKRIFEEKIATGIPGWTESFVCQKSDKHIVSYYSPIQIKGENDKLQTIGAVVTELSLVELIDSINQINVLTDEREGYITVVAKDGTYLSHPNKEYILKRNLHSLSDREKNNVSNDVIIQILNEGITGTGIVYPEHYNYSKSWVYFTPIRETDWLLIFVVPYAELFVPLYLLTLRMLFFSVLGILVIFFIVSFISKKLIQPLSSVTSQLREFSSISGEVSSTNNEIAVVSESLDYLQSWYEKFKQEQQEIEEKNTQRQQDLMEASEIQMSLINTDFSIFEKRNEVDLFAWYNPAKIVSGDLYDFIFIDNDHLFFTIGDVSGKGVPAAFFMSVAQTLLKSNSRINDPAKIVRATNHRLFSVNQNQFFLTLFCGIINLNTGEITYCNAAHTPTLVLKSEGEIVELSKTHGMPLGLYPNRKYNQATIKLKPGDSIILFSDGITEQQNARNKHFGINRFKKILQKSMGLEPKVLIEKVVKKLNRFKGEMPQSDDITIMMLKFNHKKRPE